jgi:hypothetical protein
MNKSHPLLLDNQINSRHNVLLNIYEAFFWSAGKLYNYCRDFPKGEYSTYQLSSVFTTSS